MNLKNVYVTESLARLANRREVVQVLGAGLVVVVVEPLGAVQEEDDLARSKRPVVRLEVAADGMVTLRTGKVELGQGARTLLTQCVAEEMGVAVEKVRVVMGDTELCPDDGGTWASSTTPDTVPVIRRAAAELKGRPLRSPEDWTVLGKSIAAIDGRDIVTGRKKYASDLIPSDVMHAKVVRPPYYRARLNSFVAPDGVKVIRDGDLLAVVAKTAREAEAAAGRVKAQWTVVSLGVEDLKRDAEAPVLSPGARYPGIVQQGDLQAGEAMVAKRLEAVYRVAAIAHVPLEPRAAIARWKGDRLSVEAGTQAPFLVRKELSQHFGLAEAKVRVKAVDPGSGYGGKQRSECEMEAARIAKAAGVDVRLAWSREEEFERAYVRPAGLIEVRSGVDEVGKIVSWEFHNYNAGASSLASPYDVQHSYCGFHRSKPVLREGSYRSLAAVSNNFARESHVDELAALVKADPLEFRLRNLKDARLREVLERGAEKFGWKRGKGGIACNLEKDARLALFVELGVDGKQVKLKRIVCVFDCGTILNPGNLQNQVEGAIVQGVGGALFERVEYDRERILNSRLSRYRVPRFNDIPVIETILVDRKDVKSAGAGESPITTIAPAIANGIFAATGKRLRELPLLL